MKPGAKLRRAGGRLEIALTGDWVTSEIGPTEARLPNAGVREAAADGLDRARLDLGGLGTLDTAGAWLIHATRDALRGRGLAVELAGAGPKVQSLLETAAAGELARPPAAPGENPLVAVVLRVGAATLWALGEARDLVNFLGLSVIVLLRLVVRPWRMRWVALFSHMEQAGLNALPIVGLISFLIGVVLAYQGADQLARFGAQIFTVNLVGFGVLREMGILLTAIMVAGRSGSAFTAQIGTMKVNEEIDAMRTMGLDPMEVLVAPRITALVVVVPLLTFYADILGLLGGAVMANVVLDISFYQFARQLSEAVPLWSFWVGIIKAPIFAFIIGLVGCYEGLQVTRSAESVGRQTTRSVVESVFLVIVLDALFSILFSILGV
ncbi:MAG TPA: ABC transporter permease [Kiloniellales bacterium]|nr:ABC transporter permease [Kiloniellales bacterium]